MSKIKMNLYLAQSIVALDELTRIPNLDKKPAIKYMNRHFPFI